ncbi:MAG: hypothetical protein H0W74_08060 [Sphingosinicella sp.]|nr:hypothetical protein [Sphingosinicella sp.]
MTDETQKAAAGEAREEEGSRHETAPDKPDIPLNPEERAFTGHPDHPPASPDQPVEGNEELLRREDEPGA